MCGHTAKSLKNWGFDTMLVIDHIDNNSCNNRLDNLQLLCRGCNRRKNPHRKTIKIYERAMTPEMEKNFTGERNYRNWMIGMLQTHRHISKDDAINSGAEVTKLSQETVKRYLKKMTSKAGNYALGYHSNGEVHVYEKGDEPVYDIDELEARGLPDITEQKI